MHMISGNSIIHPEVILGLNVLRGQHLRATIGEATIWPTALRKDSRTSGKLGVFGGIASRDDCVTFRLVG